MENSSRSRRSRHSSSRKSSEDEYSGENLPKILLLTDDIKSQISELPEVSDYVQRLVQFIKKQAKKISKLKQKSRKSVEKRTYNVSTQTNFSECQPHNITSEITSETEKSLADKMREAAEEAIKSSGFVYEETSGLYYDYNSGYYYNAEHGLYYDGTTGTYLKYNEQTQSYEFHSQVETPTTQDLEMPAKYKKHRRKRDKISKESIRKKLKKHEREDGECAETSSSDSGSDGDISKQWPPCMRMIVESTEIPKIKHGSLSIITCDGGTIGREGNHSVLLPDVNVSKHHSKISYDGTKYVMVDLGSRNGTFLNGKRMSSSKQESEPMEIPHGSKIQIGSTIILCHIHKGSETCGHCEPGLLIEEEKEPIPTSTNRRSINQQFKSELRRLRKGILGPNGDSPNLGEGYVDRAQKRREEIGSQNPYEKTEAASVDESISVQNKGFKLLSKMGWKEGQSLGKDSSTGLKEPVKVTGNVGSSGLGNIQPIVLVAETPKPNIWLKTQERFEKLPDKVLDESN